MTKLRKACQEKGGDLASLPTNQEIESIEPFVPEDNTMSGNRNTGGYWIGGIRKAEGSPDQWFWLTGEPIPTIHHIYGIFGDDCAAYYKLKDHPQAHITNDNCNEKRPGYICQFTSNLLQFISNSI